MKECFSGASPSRRRSRSESYDSRKDDRIERAINESLGDRGDDGCGRLKSRPGVSQPGTDKEDKAGMLRGKQAVQKGKSAPGQWERHRKEQNQ